MAKEEIQLDLTEEEVKQLETLAKENNMSIEQFIEHILRRYEHMIDDPEDLLEDI